MNKKEIKNLIDTNEEFIKGYEEFLQELEKNRKEQKDYERDK